MPDWTVWLTLPVLVLGFMGLLYCNRVSSQRIETRISVPERSATAVAMHAKSSS